MNRIIKIGTLFLFFLFTQVCPVLHCHVQEHQVEIEHHMEEHAPEILTDNLDHHDHHDQAGEHEPRNIHINDDWNYTNLLKTFKSTITVKSFKGGEIINDELPIQRRVFKNLEIRILSQFLTSTIPNRAPPHII